MLTVWLSLRGGYSDIRHKIVYFEKESVNPLGVCVAKLATINSMNISEALVLYSTD